MVFPFCSWMNDKLMARNQTLKWDMGSKLMEFGTFHGVFRVTKTESVFFLVCGRGARGRKQYELN